MKKGVSVYPLSIFIINHQSSIFINLYHNLHPFSIINLCVSAHSPNLQNFPADDFLRKISHLFPMKSWAFSKRTRCLRDQELSDTGAQHRTAIGAAALMVTQWKGAKSHRTNGENMGKMVPKCFEILFFFEILDDLVRNPMDKR